MPVTFSPSSPLHIIFFLIFLCIYFHSVFFFFISLISCFHFPPPTLFRLLLYIYSFYVYHFLIPFFFLPRTPFLSIFISVRSIYFFSFPFIFYFYFPPTSFSSSSYSLLHLPLYISFPLLSSLHNNLFLTLQFSSVSLSPLTLQLISIFITLLLLTLFLLSISSFHLLLKHHLGRSSIRFLQLGD